MSSRETHVATNAKAHSKYGLVVGVESILIITQNFLKMNKHFMATFSLLHMSQIVQNRWIQWRLHEMCA